MNIALLGGVFNPPHIGHLMIARQVLDFTDRDEVWFLPSFGQHPPKPDVATVRDRLAMANMLTIPKTRVSSLEIDHELDGNTINLLPHLPPGNDYVFVMGSDWLSSFPLWGNWKELLKRLPFYIFPRSGFACEPLYENMSVIKHELLIVTDISSTKIRNRIRQNHSVDEFVPREVVRYILEHRLYK